LLLLRRPPTSTSFPYTTLFRSELEGALVRVIAYAAIQGKEIDTELAASALHNIINKGEAKPLTPDEVIEYVSRYYQITPEDIRGDRKSTRLNSSHVSISYAVFC